MLHLACDGLWQKDAKDCDKDADCDEAGCHGWRPLWRASLYSVSLPAERKVAKLSCIIEHHDDKCDEKIEHHGYICDEKMDLMTMNVIEKWTPWQ